MNENNKSTSTTEVKESFISIKKKSSSFWTKHVGIIQNVQK